MGNWGERLLQPFEKPGQVVHQRMKEESIYLPAPDPLGEASPNEVFTLLHSQVCAYLRTAE